MRNLLRKWLGIEDLDKSILFQTKAIGRRVNYLEQKWLASGPGKIRVASTRKLVPEPTVHSAQSLLDLIKKKK